VVDLGRGENRIDTDEPRYCYLGPLQRVGYRRARTRLDAFERSLLMVWPGFQTAYDRRIGSKILLHGTQTTILDRSPPLDDAGDSRWAYYRSIALRHLIRACTLPDRRFG
jgi:hypothetical protein